VTPSLTIKGGYGKAFRAPTLKQISPNYVGAEGPHTFYGNGAIEPETSESYEIGIEWNRPEHSLHAALFRNDVTDLIDVRLQSIQGIRRFYIYDNISAARIDGVELTGEKHFDNGVSVNANYLYLHASNRTAGTRLNGTPSHGANVSLDWAGGPWQTSLRAEYIGHQYLEGTAGAARAPDYVLAHWSGAYQWTDNVRVRFGVDNIGDQRLRDKSALFGYVEPGRTIYSALYVSF
jgi:outer membrane receptor for ferrienterochelin and colicins